MTRTSKQEERRHRCPKRSRFPSAKTGPLKDKLPEGYKMHPNAIAEGHGIFIAKIKEARHV